MLKKHVLLLLCNKKLGCLIFLWASLLNREIVCHDEMMNWTYTEIWQSYAASHGSDSYWMAHSYCFPLYEKTRESGNCTVRTGHFCYVAAAREKRAFNRWGSSLCGELLYTALHWKRLPNTAYFNSHREFSSLSLSFKCAFLYIHALSNLLKIPFY